MKKTLSIALVAVALSATVVSCVDGADPSSDLTLMQNALCTPTTLKAVAAVSSGTPIQAASKAIDGNTGTRWESAYSDPQWMYVDLGAVKTITEVKIDWQHAGAKDYRIDVSNDAVTWSAAVATRTGMAPVDHRIDDLTGFSVSARYVRMFGTARATQYGYSIWELSVYDGSACGGTGAGGSGGAGTGGGAGTSAAGTHGGAGTSAAGTSGGAGTGAAGTCPVTTGKLATIAAVASAAPIQAASKAIDGNTGTRWESAHSDPQWLYVDLGAVKTVTEVKIDWQHAAAKDYRIDVSNDATTWSAAVVTKTGLAPIDHRIDDLTGFSVSARYVRMFGTARATVYGYSIWELQVFGPTASGGGASSLLTAGWSQGDVTGSFTPVSGYTFNACNKNAFALDYTGKTFATPTEPPRLTFHQSVTIPQAGASWRLTLTISGMNSQASQPPRFVGTLGDVSGASFLPTTTTVDSSSGKIVKVATLTTGSQLSMDFAGALGANDVVDLVIDNVPYFDENAAGTSGTSQHKLSVTDATLVRLN